MRYKFSNIEKLPKKNLRKSNFRQTDQKPEFVEFTNSEFVKKGIFKFGDFFFKSFFMGGAIHPFPKIMRGEMAFFFMGCAIHPSPKIMRGEMVGFDERAQGSSSACSLVRVFGESVTAMSKREDRDVRTSSLFSLLAICT